MIVADKDILCYKILLNYPEDNSFKSIYRREPYELGTLMVDKLNVKKISTNLGGEYSCAITAGCFHTFAKLKDARKEWKETFNDGVIFNVLRPVIVKCYIPKGTRYYVGTFNYLFSSAHYTSYASKQLKVTKTIISNTDKVSDKNVAR